MQLRATPKGRNKGKELKTERTSKQYYKLDEFGGMSGVREMGGKPSL